MNVGEDLEKEDFDSRHYKYLDDDGSISPIEDPEWVGNFSSVEQVHFSIVMLVYMLSLFIPICLVGHTVTHLGYV